MVIGNAPSKSEIRKNFLSCCLCLPIFLLDIQVPRMVLEVGLALRLGVS